MLHEAGAGLHIVGPRIHPAKQTCRIDLRLLPAIPSKRNLNERTQVGVEELCASHRIGRNDCPRARCVGSALRGTRFGVDLIPVASELEAHLRNAP